MEENLQREDSMPKEQRTFTYEGIQTGSGAIDSAEWKIASASGT
jgi:carbonic anhydrase